MIVWAQIILLAMAILSLIQAERYRRKPREALDVMLSECERLRFEARALREIRERFR